MKPETKEQMIGNFMLIIEQRIGFEHALRAQDAIQIQLKNEIWRKMRNGEKLSVMENAILDRNLRKVLGKDTMDVLRETARMFNEEEA